MMNHTELETTHFIENIRQSGLTIYSPVAVGDSALWIPAPELEQILDSRLVGLSLAGLPLRTRSKVVKQHICRALGYPVPNSFAKTQPRFPGQAFDTYVQKANNLQVWNEELAATRRYVIIRVSAEDIITRVKAVSGDTLAKLDTTGTLTSKYQARCNIGVHSTELITKSDTDVLLSALNSHINLAHVATPVSPPRSGELLPISTIFERVSLLIGQRFADAGVDQERNRGAALHRLVCRALGYATFQDDGQFPDVRHQILEVKLQTSPTIDLGLVRPNSTEPLDVPKIGEHQVRHCDVRYAVFYAVIVNRFVEITNVFVSTGSGFFARFPQFQGKQINAKLQIPLPFDFFNR